MLLLEKRLAECRSTLVLAVMLLMGSAVHSQEHSVVVQAGEGENSVRTIATSIETPYAALADALQRCESRRQAALLQVQCEPVAYNDTEIPTAQQLRQRALGELAEGASARLSLFQLRGESTQLTLFGSVHLMKRNAYPLNAQIMRAFDQADTLALEVDLRAVTPQQLQQAFLSRGLFQPGKNLATELSTATVQKIQAVLAARGLDFKDYARMKPWMFEQTLITQEMQLLGFEPESGIDSYFDQRARAQGKVIVQLESLDEQLDLLSRMPLADQELSLAYSLDSLQSGSAQEELYGLVVDWLQGDIDNMYKDMMEPVRAYPQLQAYMTAMFDDRNEKMAAKISAWIEQGGHYFVIVGAGHLGGPKGVVALLQQRGYRLEQLSR